MGQKEEDQEVSASALAALVRTSAAPPAHDEPPDAEPKAKNGEDDDAILDLRALATSQAPPPPEVEPAAPEPAKAEPVKKAEPEKVERPDQAVRKVTPSERAVSMQPAPAASRGSGGMITGIVIGVAVAGAAAFFMMRSGAEEEPPAEQLAAAEPRSIAATDIDEPAPLAPAAEALPAEAPTEPVDTAGAVDTPAEEAAAAREPRAARARRSETSRASSQASEEATAMQAAAPTEPAPTTMQAAAPAEPAAQQGGSQQIDSLLDNALGGRPAAGGTKTVPTERTTAAAAASGTASAELPDTPTRADVARTLGRLMPQIRQCAADQVGLANATIMVRNDGSVGSVAIAGHPFGGTPQGACMEGVIRGARFSPFRQSTFRITYPFALRPTP